MDILDTFGDWLQLFGFAFLYYSIANLAAGAWGHSKFMQVVVVIVINYILWISVFDYDIVLGYILGAAITARNARNHYKKIWVDFDPRFLVRYHNNPYGFLGALLCSRITIVIMGIKIILFWK